ncbi:AraC family transcriptional regulator [Agrobacterium tumefaciens]|uniref:AraC family transcriptional regulator n=1 Tax=Agrobacterium tumefaciens TaxID=358 RepID=UPI001B8A461A|nr:AraC family transcriptional regulator [Agrobacterium tumefaciens]WCK69065.1 AraC family transcriptional regulator [Agrobacterium tumefaciens]
MNQFVRTDNLDSLPVSASRSNLAPAALQLCSHEQINSSIVPGLKFFMLSKPDEPHRCFYEPCLAVILSGVKRVMFDKQEMLFHSGDFFVTSIDIPTSAHVVEASAENCYVSMIMKIDLARLHELAKHMQFSHAEGVTHARGVATGHASEELLVALKRLIDLANRPGDIPLLVDAIKSEIYVRLLQSEVGFWVSLMASDGYKAAGIVKALEWLKNNYAQALRIEALAEMSGMAVSTFHHNFRQLTGTSPLQYQKTLRLYGARNLMLTERINANGAAGKVGYDSVQQFSREYARMFGAPPKRDVDFVRRGLSFQRSDT